MPQKIVQGTLLATSFTVPLDGIQPTLVTYDYATLAGNQPSAYANTAFLWQTSDDRVPIGQPPANQTGVTGTSPDGSNVFQGLQIGELPYLLAYAVGPAIANICATVFIPPEEGETPVPQDNSPSLGVDDLGPNTVVVNYQMPPGTQPVTDLDWVGLWEGNAQTVLYTVPPIVFAAVAQNDSRGHAALAGMTILRDTAYTVGYFKGGYAAQTPKQTTLACAFTFTS